MFLNMQIFEYCTNSESIRVDFDLFTLTSFWQHSDESLGQGQLLIQTVKLAFSVTNNVIRLKPPSSVVSPLEQALTQHGTYFLVGQSGKQCLFLISD